MGGNTIVGNVVNNNVLTGIILAEGTVETTVSGNKAHGNGRDKALIAQQPFVVWVGVDGADLNPGCASNVWSANRFGTVNQRCVKASGGAGKVVGPGPTAAGMAARLSTPPGPQRGHLLLQRGGPQGAGG